MSKKIKKKSAPSQLGGLGKRAWTLPARDTGGHCVRRRIVPSGLLHRAGVEGVTCQLRLAFELPTRRVRRVRRQFVDPMQMVGELVQVTTAGPAREQMSTSIDFPSFLMKDKTLTTQSIDYDVDLWGTSQTILSI
jgi:hypothetical protein